MVPTDSIASRNPATALRTPRTGLSLPDGLEQIGADLSVVQEPLQRAEEFNAEYGQALKDQQGARVRLDAAKSADHESYAKALESGEEPPDASEVEKIERELHELDRRVEGLKLARERAINSARTAIDEATPRWISESQSAEDHAAERYAAAIEELRAARAGYQQARDLVRWLRDPNHRLRPAAPDRSIAGPGGASGAPTIDMGRVFETLRDEARAHVSEREKAAAPKVEMRRDQPQRYIQPDQDAS